MTIAVDLGSKANKQTNKPSHISVCRIDFYALNMSICGEKGTAASACLHCLLENSAIEEIIFEAVSLCHAFEIILKFPYYCYE